MQRYLFIVIMFWNLLFGSSTQAQDWANKARYAQANQSWTRGEAGPCRVVMMGNSITEFWAEMHPAFFADNGLVGRGIGGQVSSQMLVRFRQDVINLHPRVVVINCGTNDIAENNGPYDEDITVDNIRSMVELALGNDIQVVLSSVLPSDGFVWNPSVKHVQEKIQSLNNRIIAMAQEYSLPYINYYGSMVHGKHRALHPAYTDDGVHPTGAGYEVMEELLLEVLEHINW